MQDGSKDRLSLRITRSSAVRPDNISTRSSILRYYHKTKLITLENLFYISILNVFMCSIMSSLTVRGGSFEDVTMVEFLQNIPDEVFFTKQKDD